jgi:hypothetical protein
MSARGPLWSLNILFDTPHLEEEEALDSQPIAKKIRDVTCASMNDTEINHTCEKEDMKAHQT